ncbi:hypothetical protein EX30DRAFT_372282 [Ascodesmis nigricans]|uniref:C2H2-type domain-containing protein n=1 Tax=Ascodesmis nigricans TaxID=341454 RepID=A0A4S2MUT1_9PEZI|nr:hypothetical protein EX30DRAFT_372282 [Ascodesmis nigricans]
MPRLPPILGFSSAPTEEPACHSAHGDESPFPFPRFPSPAARTNRSSIDSTMDEEGAALGRLDIRATPPLSSSYPTTRRKRRAHSPPPSIYGPFSGASEPSRKEPMLDTHMDILGRRTPPIHHGYPHSAGLRTSPSWRANTFSSSSSQQSSVLRSMSTGPLSVTSTPSSSLESSRWPQMLQTGSESSSSSSSATIRGYSPIAHGASDVHGFIRDPPQPQLRRTGPPHMCTCCPKKPKRFETQEDLNAHEAEKQYKCLYCNNRFKNKNEAERHQNSLHLRRYSWSCVVLADNFQAAFHPLLPPSSSSSSSSSTPAPPPPQIDICGYCGEEFPLASVNGDKKEWQERKYLHLQDQHKFGECNQQKKFYRADHFRQHLKHSHGGTSGKWTNELEKSCMQPEEGV